MSSGQFMDTVITPGARASVKAACDTIYDRSQALVPVDTGALKSSGVVEIDDSGRTVVGTVRYTADHAEYVEFGTGQRGAASAGAGAGPYSENWPGMAAQPYLRPAFDETKPAILDLFRSNIATQLRQ
jgi:HK97 gp10 family phage protein